METRLVNVVKLQMLKDNNKSGCYGKNPLRRRRTSAERRKARENQSKADRYATMMRRAPTKAEAGLIEILNAEGIRFRFQKAVYDSNHCYIADFYFPKPARLVVEVDGPSHEGEKARAYDKRRTEFFTNRRRCKVVRFSNEDIFNSASSVLNRIKLLVTGS